MDTAGHKVAIVIPCYKVRQHIEDVIAEIPDWVAGIYVVDDSCPEKSGALVSSTFGTESRLSVLYHDKNQGVGAAVVTGMRAAIKDGGTIIVKMDGDGQMDPALLPLFVQPILDNEADYTKGNRFFWIEGLKSMPFLRLFGNATLSFLSKFSTGYWNVFDPTNGYVAIDAGVAKELLKNEVSRRYFFESDILYRLNLLQAVVKDIPMYARYGDEKSSLKITHIVLPFLAKHCANFLKRIFYNYFLRGFTIATIELLLGTVLLFMGLFFGVQAWHASLISAEPSSAGTVMLAALPIITGIQLLLAFLNYDVSNVPKVPIRMALATRERVMRRGE